MSDRKTGHRAFLLVLFFVVYITYMIWRIGYTLPFNLGYASLIFGLLLVLAEIVGFIEACVFYATIWKTDTPPTPEAENSEFPDVDVFIASYNEPSELLYKTIIGCKNMDYPQKEKVHIYICDDGHRKEIAELCQRLKVGYITRQDNAHAKAGNLNNALKQTNSPLFVTFDADMIPMHSFLTKTIPYFLTGEKIGFVQVPQYFYNTDLFQFNLFSEKTTPNEQDMFSFLIQAGKYRFNAIIYAGSNTVISRQAVNEVGGIVVGTITEDFATGMKIQSAGYKSIYVNEVLASGLAPETLEDVFNQRIRWGRGVVQTFKKHSPLTQKGLNIMQKLMYLSSYTYWYFGLWRFIFLAAPIAFSLFNVVVLNAPPEKMLIFWLPMFFASSLIYKLLTKNVRTTTWSHVYDTLLFPQITLGVVLETFGFKLSKFKVTPKDKVQRISFINKFSLVKLQIILAFLSAAGVLRLIYLSVFSGFQPSYLINLFWLSYNLYLLLMAIFLSSERPKYRGSERLTVSTCAAITVKGKKYWGATEDISEGGISILFKEPFYIDPDEIYLINVKTERYKASCFGKIIRVDNDSSLYKYSFRINMDETNYQQMIGIIFDRIPEAPRVAGNNGMFETIKRNLSNRVKPSATLNRKLPRISVKKEVTAIYNNEPVKVYMLDFNYSYCSFKADVQYPAISIPMSKEGRVVLYGVLKKELSSKERSVYYISNYEELVNVEIELAGEELYLSA